MGLTLLFFSVAGYYDDSIEQGKLPYHRGHFHATSFCTTNALLYRKYGKFICYRKAASRLLLATEKVVVYTFRNRPQLETSVS